MNEIEKNEIEQLPQKYRPLTAWAYFGYTILYSIPLIGLIFLIIHALSADNINRRSFARSYFCVIVLVLIFTLICVLTGSISALISSLQ